MTFEWLAYSAGAPKVPHILYKVTVNAPLGLDTTSRVLWSGPSGGPMIVEWATEALPPNKYQDWTVGHALRGRQPRPVPLAAAPSRLHPGDAQ